MTLSADDSLSAARLADVNRFIVIGTDAQSSIGAIELASKHPDVWATVGLHPHDATLGTNTVAHLLPSARVVAVGECGLDYYYEHSPRTTQRQVFAEHIALAKQHDLTLVIHTRDAWDDTFDVLDTEGLPQRTVLHCFTGGPDEARKCLDRGAFLSFSGIVTFKNSADNQAAARICPPDRLLIETDSPYLAPAPQRGRPNQPAFVGFVGTAIADLRGQHPSIIAESTSAAAVLAFPGIGS